MEKLTLELFGKAKEMIMIKKGNTLSYIKTIQVMIILMFSWLLISCSSVNHYSNAEMLYMRHAYPLSFDELIKATDSGQCNPEAQYALGYMYYYGLGIAKDRDIGRMWIRKSAKHHYPPALQAWVIINNTSQLQNSSFE